MAAYRVVLMTCAKKKQARALARGLVQARLAACVNIVPGIESHYRWKGKIEKAGELLLIAKTRAERVEALTDWVRARHSYDTPEIVALDVAAGHAAYLGWVGENS